MVRPLAAIGLPNRFLVLELTIRGRCQIRRRSRIIRHEFEGTGLLKATLKRSVPLPSEPSATDSILDLWRQGFLPFLWVAIGAVVYIVIREAVFRDLNADTFANLLIVGSALAGYMVIRRWIPRREQPGSHVLAELDAHELRVYVDAHTHVTIQLQNVAEIQILTSEDDNAVRLVMADGSAFRSYVPISYEALCQVAEFANRHLGDHARPGL